MSAFEEITEASFLGKGGRSSFSIRRISPSLARPRSPNLPVHNTELQVDPRSAALVLGGVPTDNEFVKLAWRRDHKDLKQAADLAGVRRHQRFAWWMASASRSPDGGRQLATLHRRPAQCDSARLRSPMSVGRNLKDECGCASSMRTVRSTESLARVTPRGLGGELRALCVKLKSSGRLQAALRERVIRLSPRQHCFS